MFLLLFYTNGEEVRWLVHFLSSPYCASGLTITHVGEATPTQGLNLTTTYSAKCQLQSVESGCMHVCVSLTKHMWRCCSSLKPALKSILATSQFARTADQMKTQINYSRDFSFSHELCIDRISIPWHLQTAQDMVLLTTVVSVCTTRAHSSILPYNH